MSKVLSEFPAEHKSRNAHPWGKWLNGEIWEISQSDLPNAQLQHFPIHIYKVAKQRGLKVRIYKEPNRIVIQAYKP